LPTATPNLKPDSKVFLPLWGLYPGDPSFFGPLSHLFRIYAWIIGAAISEGWFLGNLRNHLFFVSTLGIIQVPHFGHFF
jgi:hypothetical protein